MDMHYRKKDEKKLHYIKIINLIIKTNTICFRVNLTECRVAFDNKTAALLLTLIKRRKCEQRVRIDTAIMRFNNKQY